MAAKCLAYPLLLGSQLQDAAAYMQTDEGLTILIPGQTTAQESGIEYGGEMGAICRSSSSARGGGLPRVHERQAAGQPLVARPER